MNPYKRHSGPTTLQDVELGLVELKVTQELQHKAAMTAIDGMGTKIEDVVGEVKRLREDMSSHGAPPVPKGRGKGKAADGSDEGKKPGGWGIREGTGREIALIATAVITVIASSVSAIQSIRNGANASTAALEGAQQAIEHAVEQADVVPVAVPPVVVPVPRVVPVPVPVPVAAPDPEPSTTPDELLERGGP